MPIARLDRAVFRLSGENVQDWLSGLITNSLAGDMTFAALLTPQGKIIADFFISKTDDALLLDTPSKFAADLEKRLKMYRLRAPITIETISEEMKVYALWDGQGDIGHPDPRLPTLGHRLLSPDSLDADGDYDAHRLSLGIPDSQWDFDSASVFPADAYMDTLSGIDYKKGCFIGQEVASRMRRMTIVKKRMRGLVLEGEAKAGDKIMSGDRVIGDVLHFHGKAAMGLIRLDRLKTATLGPTVNGHAVAIMRAPDGSNT